MKFIQPLLLRTSLIRGMVVRDVIGRYNGSFLGLLWSMFNPLLMLFVYTFAFGFIFKSRWSGLGDDPYSFALALFPALLVFNYFSECVNRAPGLVVGNASYVKKVVFPLEILAVVASLSALFHFCVGFVVWCVVYVLFEGALPVTVLLMPLVIVPLFLFTLGVTWMLASLGVFLRDVQQVVGVLTSALIFLSPVFYSLDSIPERFREMIQLNPLTYFVESARDVMVFGKGLSFGWWGVAMLSSCVVACIGAWWFKVTRKGFADVL